MSRSEKQPVAQSGFCLPSGFGYRHCTTTGTGCQVGVVLCYANVTSELDKR